MDIKTLNALKLVTKHAQEMAESIQIAYDAQVKYQEVVGRLDIMLRKKPKLNSSGKPGGG